MKVAIVYKSLTGNTELVAQAIREGLADEVVYFGGPQDVPKADLYFVGSWTDKGMCCEEIGEFLKTAENMKIAYFGTAGFGGSQAYYQGLFQRIKEILPPSSELKDYFFCQGKMPMRVRERYVSMLAAHPGDKKLEASVKNFDEASSHPNQEDLRRAELWAETCVDL